MPPQWLLMALPLGTWQRAHGGDGAPDCHLWFLAARLAHSLPSDSTQEHLAPALPTYDLHWWPEVRAEGNMAPHLPGRLCPRYPGTAVTIPLSPHCVFFLKKDFLWQLWLLCICIWVQFCGVFLFCFVLLFTIAIIQSLEKYY